MKMTAIENDIIQMLQNKPEVKKSNDFWPTETGIYSISGIKSYMKSKGYSSDLTDQGINHLVNDSKIKLECINVKNKKYNEYYPYYFMDLKLEEAVLLKQSYETKH